MFEVQGQRPIARTVLPERRLYKYRSIADETQLQRLKENILGHKIRFSRLSELNDPIEGKPVYVLGDWDSSEYRQEFVEWAWDVQKKHLENLPPRDAFVTWLLAQSCEMIERYIASMNQEIHAAIEVKWRVLSLSATPTHDLMWSHYADGHKGVALVFDASQGEFALAFQVSYTPDRMNLDITSKDETATLNATLLQKRDSWAYEQEFRSIAPEPWEPDTVRLESQFLGFQPSQLLGVIFGARTTSENQAEVMGWATQRPQPLDFWKASINPAGSVEMHQIAL